MLKFLGAWVVLILPLWVNFIFGMIGGVVITTGLMIRYMERHS